MITDLQLIKSQKPQTTHCKRSERAVLSDVRDNPQAASEDRRVGARSEPTEKRNKETEAAPGDATQTAAGRVYRPAEKGERTVGGRKY